MSEKNVENNTKNRNIVSSILIVEVMVFITLLISEFYLIKRMPENYLIILGGGIFVIIDVYLITDEIIKIINKSYKQKMLQIEEYMKSQKAIYLCSKKGFEGIIEKLEEVDKSTREAIDNLFSGQKTIGKTMIKKNMESLAEVRTAVETLNLQISELKPNENNPDNLSAGIEHFEQAVITAIQNSSEEFSQLKNECVSIREACGILIEKLDNINIEELLKQNVNQMPEEKPAPEQEQILGCVPEATLEDEPEQILEPEPELTLNQEPEEIPELLQVQPSEEPVLEESQDLLEEMGISESDGLFNSETENEIMNQDIFDEESILANLNEFEQMDLLGDFNLNLDGEQIETDTEAESTGTEKTDEPEEIGEQMEITQQQETEPEKEPVQAPDLSDPNKQMSPDDIAALIASMQS
ncbi:MAG: hypothetical protein K2O02_03150 [Lachnospiraceae bacterium]|nr:hypothetical protein [Lachnospiraceae bacterium]